MGNSRYFALSFEDAGDFRSPLKTLKRRLFLLYRCSIKTYKTPKRIGCYRHNATDSGLPTVIRQYNYPPYGIRQLCEEAALKGGYTVSEDEIVL